MSDKYDEGRRRLLKGMVAIGLGAGSVLGPTNALADSDVPNSAGSEAPVLRCRRWRATPISISTATNFLFLTEKASLPLHASVKDFASCNGA